MTEEIGTSSACEVCTADPQDAQWLLAEVRQYFRTADGHFRLRFGSKQEQLNRLVDAQVVVSQRIKARPEPCTKRRKTLRSVWHWRAAQHNATGLTGEHVPAESY